MNLSSPSTYIPLLILTYLLHIFDLSSWCSITLALGGRFGYMKSGVLAAVLRFNYMNDNIDKEEMRR